MDIEINPEKFFRRLERLQAEWLAHKSDGWQGADALCIPFGAEDEATYSKSVSLHMYLLGCDILTDSIILISKNQFYFMASTKKCDFLKKQFEGKTGSFTLHFIERTKDEGMTRENFNMLMGVVRKSGGKKLGSLFKDQYKGNFVPQWMEFVEQSQIEKAEISASLGLFFAVKDETELDLCKRAAILTNKIMKHGFKDKMESILDNGTKATHSALADQMEEIINDPSKIDLKLAPNTVEVCYSPIIQSGGQYDLKLSAASSKSNLSANVILCSLGARYRGYCATISRTFLVDAPSKVEKLYGTLIGLHSACLEKMIVGNELKDVYEGARAYLKGKDESLLSYLPKTLGFSMGLEFRDSTLLLNQTNAAVFKEGMVFNISVSFHNVPLSAADKEGAPEAVKQLSTFSLQISDMVAIQKDGVPDVLTKLSKEFGDISYNMGDQDDDEDDKEDDDDEEDDSKPRAGAAASRTRRRDPKEMEAAEASAAVRYQFQQELMQRRLEEARQRIKNGGAIGTQQDEQQVEAKDLAVYRSESEFPRDRQPNRLKVDMDKECVLVPIDGRHIPFHISTIKGITQPSPEMRINFYIPGGAMGKECAKNMQQLVLKYGSQYAFIKELTFRSHDGKNLSAVYQQFMELRKRIKQRELKAEQEKDLVTQAKLIKIKSGKVSSINNVNVRPTISGKKCQGHLQAHENGFHFVSTKGEVLDILYSNIKHAIFQPCERTTIVLIHFHLKDFILVNKKRQKDIQFFSEVVSSSVNLEGSKRSAYDPDEVDDEQRERQLKRTMNNVFKDFCGRVEKTAKDFGYNLQFDVPFKKSGFEGNWSREMVLLQPTAHCLVNLTEWPAFVLALGEVEHVHFERVTYATRNFDITFIFKNWELPPKTITAVDAKSMDVVQDWLNLVEITFTKGPRSLNWTDVMKIVREERETFYDDVDEDGVSKPAGWLFLSADGVDEDEEDEEDEDSSFGGDESDSEEDDSDEDDSSLEDDDDDSEDDYEEEEDLEEQGMDWDELHRQAAVDDKMKEREAKRSREEEDQGASKKKQKR